MGKVLLALLLIRYLTSVASHSCTAGNVMQLLYNITNAFFIILHKIVNKLSKIYAHTNTKKYV
jgi:hypothetical protein